MTEHDRTDTARLLDRLADTFPDRPAPLSDLVAAAHAGRRRRVRRTMALTVAAVLLGIGSGAALRPALPDDQRSEGTVADTPRRATCDKQSPVPPREPVPRGPDYPTNAAGETYGSAIDNSPQPDLLAAIGDCGRTGYIRPGSLDEPPPWVPGAGSGEPRSTPVLESDGVTQIDTFTRDRGKSSNRSTGGSAAPPGGPDSTDVQERWTAVIAGTATPGATEDDTFRDLRLAITFAGQEVQVVDGCRTWTAGFTLTDGAFDLTGPFTAEGGSACDRAAPLPDVLENVRHVTQSGGRTYLHLGNFRIAVQLTRA